MCARAVPLFGLGRGAVRHPQHQGTVIVQPNHLCNTYKVRCGFFSMPRSILKRATSVLRRAISAYSAVTAGACLLSAVSAHWLCDQP